MYILSSGRNWQCSTDPTVTEEAVQGGNRPGLDTSQTWGFPSQNRCCLLGWGRSWCQDPRAGRQGAPAESWQSAQGEKTFYFPSAGRGSCLKARLSTFFVCLLVCLLVVSHFGWYEGDTDLCHWEFIQPAVHSIVCILRSTTGYSDT